MVSQFFYASDKTPNMKVGLLKRSMHESQNHLHHHLRNTANYA